MSYQVLARKYRPGRLQDVVGQPQTVQALINAFDRGQLHHAYMFSGTRGVGKTTLARIIAKCLNCKNGVTSMPCGVCDNCVSIGDGSYVDLIEVDGASRNKVEETRELLDDIEYLPSMGTFKVYIIDEVHALSDSSFQTLLKSLEEPPEHVKFVLATTNPDKVPVTVRSRCLQFHLRNMSMETIDAHLRTVLAAENIAYDEPSVRLLARAGQGSMRDALSITDQALALCGNELTETTVLEMLGSAPQNDVAVLLEKLVTRQRQPVLEVMADLANRGVDFAELLAGLESGVHALAMAKATSTSPGEALAPLLDQVDTGWLQQAYQALIMGGRDLQYAPEPRVGFEMTMLRLLDFVPIVMDSAADQATQQTEISVATDVLNERNEVPPPSAEPAGFSQPNSSTTGDVSPKQSSAPALRSSSQPSQRADERAQRFNAKRVERLQQQDLAREQEHEQRLNEFTTRDEEPYIKIFEKKFNATFRTEHVADDDAKA